MTAPSESPAAQGFAFLATGDFDAALDEAKKLAVSAPDCAEAYLIMGIAYARKEEIDKAIAALRQGEIKHPNEFAFPYNSGILLRSINKHDEALASFDTAMALDRTPAPELMDIAKYAYSQGHARKAQTALRLLLKITPNDSEALALFEEIKKVVDRAERSLIKNTEFLNAKSRYPAPYIGFTGKPFSLHERGNPLDAWGFPNDAPPALEPTPGERRVFILGDSTMFNGAGTDKKTIPDMVQENLRSKGIKDVRIYNFAVMSSRAAQMLALLFFRLVEYRPDLIVMVCGAAETYIPRAYDPRKDHPYNFYVVEELYDRFFDFSHPDHKNNNAVQYTELLSGIAAKQAELRIQAGISQSEQWETGIIDAFDAVLNKLEKIASAYSLNVAVLLQPLVNTKTPLTEEEHRTCAPETMHYFQRQYARYKKLLFPNGEKISRRGCLELRDATDVFDGCQNAIYTDFVHYNYEGSQLIAARITKTIEDKLS